MKGFLLDTNIISELRKGSLCNPSVREWYETIEDSKLFLSVLVLGEIRRGIEIRRLKDVPSALALEKWLKGLESGYSDRILPVTVEICDRWGKLSPRTPLPSIDGLLAATAIEHHLTLVTRNKADVLRSGVDCFDPFTDFKSKKN